MTLEYKNIHSKYNPNPTLTCIHALTTEGHTLTISLQQHPNDYLGLYSPNYNLWCAALPVVGDKWCLEYVKSKLLHEVL